jgi:hypothetical protein
MPGQDQRPHAENIASRGNASGALRLPGLRAPNFGAAGGVGMFVHARVEWEVWTLRRESFRTRVGLQLRRPSSGLRPPSPRERGEGFQSDARSQKKSRFRGSFAATCSRWPGLPTRRGRFQGQASLGCATGSGSRRGASHRLATNQTNASAPTLKSVSAGTRIHTSMSTIGCCMNSAERANQ